MTSTMGSDGWLDDTRLSEGTELEESALRCLRTVKWNKIAEMCSKLRPAHICNIRKKFSMGTENLVKLIEFADGVKWVARISLEDEDGRHTASKHDQMVSQVATYRYLKQHTNVPVPEVHAYDASSENEIGASYMLLTYIHGNVADKCHLNSDQSRHVLNQMVEIMVKLAAHTFDCIGCLSVDEEGHFTISTDLETNGGPYKTAQEYYNATSVHRFHHYADRYFRNNGEADCEPGLHLPFLFNNLMPMLTDCMKDTGPFFLTNTDFGMHNVLVDANLNIVGIIDCDSLMAAPIHVTAQYETLLGRTIPLPGLATQESVTTQTFVKGKVDFDYLVERVAIAETKLHGNTPIADAMVSDGARLVEGLHRYRAMQDWVNAEWVKSYWYMYYRSLGSSRCVEFANVDRPLNKEESAREEDSPESSQNKPGGSNGEGTLVANGDKKEKLGGNFLQVL